MKWEEIAVNEGFVTAAQMWRTVEGTITNCALANYFDCHQSTIRNQKRKCGIKAPPVGGDRSWAGGGRNKISKRIRDEIIKLRIAGFLQNEIAERLEISMSTVKKYQPTLGELYSEIRLLQKEVIELKNHIRLTSPI